MERYRIVKEIGYSGCIPIVVYCVQVRKGKVYYRRRYNRGTVLYCFPEGPNDGGNWDTYEEALEAGIIKALKLI